MSQSLPSPPQATSSLPTPVQSTSTSAAFAESPVMGGTPAAGPAFPSSELAGIECTGPSSGPSARDEAALVTGDEDVPSSSVGPPAPSGSSSSNGPSSLMAMLGGGGEDYQEERQLTLAFYNELTSLSARNAGEHEFQHVARHFAGLNKNCPESRPEIDIIYYIPLVLVTLHANDIPEAANQVKHCSAALQALPIVHRLATLVSAVSHSRHAIVWAVADEIAQYLSQPSSDQVQQGLNGIFRGILSSFKTRYEVQTVQLVTSVFTAISPSDLGVYVGRSASDVLTWATTQARWPYDQMKDLLTPVKSPCLSLRPTGSHEFSQLRRSLLDLEQSA